MGVFGPAPALSLYLLARHRPFLVSCDYFLKSWGSLSSAVKFSTFAMLPCASRKVKRTLYSTVRNPLLSGLICSILLSGGYVRVTSGPSHFQSFASVA